MGHKSAPPRFRTIFGVETVPRHDSISQWGPNQTDRGNNGSAGAAGSLDRASIGPRSADRGNGATSPTGQVQRPASMEPRSADRGNYATGPPSSLLSSSFNG